MSPRYHVDSNGVKVECVFLIEEENLCPSAESVFRDIDKSVPVNNVLLVYRTHFHDKTSTIYD